MAAIRVSGMNSGLDTDSIVSALVQDTKTKKESYEKAKTKLEWKQDAWKSINSKVTTLFNKASNLRWSSAYSLKKTTVSDMTKASVSASNTAVTGTQKLNILSVAQSGYLTGGKLSRTASTSTTLAELGYTGGDATINVDKGDGTSASITVSASTTIADITKALGDQGLNASLDTTNNRLFVSSKETGLANDFNLIAGDTKGLEALQKLGLTTSIAADSATYATYNKYGVYATTADGEVITDESVIRENILASLDKYKNARELYNDYTSQYDNLKSISQTYAGAYSKVQDFLAEYGSANISGDNDVFNTIILMSSSERANTLVSDNNEKYSLMTKKDADGNSIYSKKNDDGSTSYITAVETYTDESTGKVYSKKTDGSYVNVDDAEDVYKDDTSKLTKKTDYYEATEKISFKSGDQDADGNPVSYDIQTREVDGKTQYYFEKDGQEYVSDSITGSYKNGDDAISVSNVDYDYEKGAQQTDLTLASERYSALQTEIEEKLVAAGKTEEEAKVSAATVLSEFAGNYATVTNFEKQAAEAADTEDATENKRQDLIDAIKAAYTTGGSTAVDTLAKEYNASLAELGSKQDAQKAIMDANEAVSSLADITDTTEYENALAKMIQTAKTGATVLHDSDSYTAAAVKIDGTDAHIKLNGVDYYSDSNNITVNGLTVSATGVTGDGDENAITISTQVDSQGIYDKIKDLLTEYNKVINDLVSQYNAEYQKDYEPLTDDEKDEMSDKEVEKWEEKAKSALLRHDSTVNGLITSMTSAMFSSIEINGKNYALSSFGISTLGYLNAEKNEQYAYHIDGDEDDEVTSGKDDKLMAMINSDPETVVDFFKELSSKLYKNINEKMGANDLSSANTVYNDKQMTKEINNYTKLIKTWEEKLSDKEDYYYNKFTQMEKAMASLNSTQSSLSGYFS